MQTLHMRYHFLVNFVYLNVKKSLPKSTGAEMNDMFFPNCEIVLKNVHLNIESAAQLSWISQNIQ